MALTGWRAAEALPAGGPRPAGQGNWRLSRIHRIRETARTAPKGQTLVPITELFQITERFPPHPLQRTCSNAPFPSRPSLVGLMSFPLRLFASGSFVFFFAATLAVSRILWILERRVLICAAARSRGVAPVPQEGAAPPPREGPSALSTPFFPPFPLLDFTGG